MPAMRDVAEPFTPLLVALRDLLAELPSRIPEIDTHELEIFGVAKAVGDVLARAIVLFRSIEDATNVPLSPPDLEAMEPDAWTPSTTRSASIADVCFGGSMELRRAERELLGARTPTEQVVAIDAVMRKLRRAVRAVLETARDVDGIDLLGGAHQGAHKVSDLQSGLAVRRLYADFRAALRTPTAHTPEAVMEAMRYAAGALASLVASPDYADVRAEDRSLFRGTRERILRWARDNRSVRAGLDILADVAACGELLRGINQRQELRVHDQDIARMFSSVGLDEWLAHSDALRGLDDAVDQWIIQAQGARGHDDRAAIATHMVARLKQITGVSS